MAGPPTGEVPERFVGSSIEAVTAVHLRVARGCRSLGVLLLAPDEEAAFAWAAGIEPGSAVELVVVPDRTSASYWLAAEAGNLAGYPRPEGATGACRDGYERLCEIEAAGDLRLRVLKASDRRLAGRATDRFVYRDPAGATSVVTRERGSYGQPDSGLLTERLTIERGTTAAPPASASELDELLTSLPLRDPAADRPPTSASALPSLRPYQRAAVGAWLGAGGRGIMALATGTGKTFTAVSAMERVVQDRDRGLVVAVLAPQVHLVDQWTRELRHLRGRTTACHTATDRWRGPAATDVALVRAGQRDLAVLAATHATAALPAFQELLASVPGEQLMLVVDEAHHYASRGTSDLPGHAELRLGLTATPPDVSTDAGKALTEHLGGVVATYGIRDAIRDGYLCPYRYRTHPVALSDDELDRFREVSRELTRALEEPPATRDSGRVEELVRTRSDVIDQATGKLEVLGRLLDATSPDRTIVYCSGRPQLEAVLSLCWDRGIGAHPFTGEEPAGQRSAVLERFADGRVPALVAIRCLDEGVDVPAAREAYLLRSSTNPAQAVQRRGRLLRRHPGKDVATIHDLVIATADPELRELESQRVRTFAQDALDGERTLQEHAAQEGRTP